jgi:transcriptional regulator with XRE-family HTH domain
MTKWEEMIGQALENLRESKKLTKRELASRLGVNHNTLYLWERGTNLSLETIFRVLEALEVSPKELGSALNPEPLKVEHTPEDCVRNLSSYVKDMEPLRTRVPADILQSIPFVANWQMFRDILQPFLRHKKAAQDAS